jgi:hypothetical protein
VRCAHGFGAGSCGFSGFQPCKTSNFTVAFPKTEVLGKPLLKKYIDKILRKSYTLWHGGRMNNHRDICLLVTIGLLITCISCNVGAQSLTGIWVIDDKIIEFTDSNLYKKFNVRTGNEETVFDFIIDGNSIYITTIFGKYPVGTFEFINHDTLKIIENGFNEEKYFKRIANVRHYVQQLYSIREAQLAGMYFPDKNDKQIEFVYKYHGKIEFSSLYDAYIGKNILESENRYIEAISARKAGQVAQSGDGRILYGMVFTDIDSNREIQFLTLGDDIDIGRRVRVYYWAPSRFLQDGLRGRGQLYDDVYIHAIEYMD